MFYTIYKTINLINGKVYIGKHETENQNDNYLGSGNNIKRALNKYGKENFKKEILFIFDTEDEMNAKEAELVTEEFVLEDTNYNICPGGKGGWGYINKNNLSPINNGSERHLTRCSKAGIKSAEKQKELMKNEEWVKNKSLAISSVSKQRIKDAGKHWNKGVLKHTDEWKLNQSNLMKEKQGGLKNSQYGSIWITNGCENRKMKSDGVIPEGWYKGRIMRM